MPPETGVCLVRSAETERGAALCHRLRERGWTVIGDDSDPSETIDLLVWNGAAPSPDILLTDSPDFDGILRTYETETLAALRVIETLLPRTENGKKRLCFVTDAAGSLGAPIIASDIGTAMAATALHRAVKILFNDLRADGYTFRLFIPDENDSEGSASAACDCFLTDRDDEDRLRMVDFRGAEVPF